MSDPNTKQNVQLYFIGEDLEITSERETIEKSEKETLKSLTCAGAGSIRVSTYFLIIAASSQ